MKGFMYQVVLSPDEGGAWQVSVPDLPGCFTCGDSREEALLMTADARGPTWQRFSPTSGPSRRAPRDPARLAHRTAWSSLRRTRSTSRRTLPRGQPSSKAHWRSPAGRRTRGRRQVPRGGHRRRPPRPLQRLQRHHLQVRSPLHPAHRQDPHEGALLRRHRERRHPHHRRARQDHQRQAPRREGEALTSGGPRRSPRPTAGTARHRKLLCNRWFLSPAAPGRR